MSKKGDKFSIPSWMKAESMKSKPVSSNPARYEAPSDVSYKRMSDEKGKENNYKSSSLSSSSSNWNKNGDTYLYGRYKKVSEDSYSSSSSHSSRDKYGGAYQYASSSSEQYKRNNDVKPLAYSELDKIVRDRKKNDDKELLLSSSSYKNISGKCRSYNKK